MCMHPLNRNRNRKVNGNGNTNENIECAKNSKIPYLSVLLLVRKSFEQPMVNSFLPMV